VVQPDTNGGVCDALAGPPSTPTQRTPTTTTPHFDGGGDGNAADGGDGYLSVEGADSTPATAAGNLQRRQQQQQQQQQVPYGSLEEQQQQQQQATEAAGSTPRVI